MLLVFIRVTHRFSDNVKQKHKLNHLFSRAQCHTIELDDGDGNGQWAMAMWLFSIKCCKVIGQFWVKTTDHYRLSSEWFGIKIVGRIDHLCTTSINMHKEKRKKERKNERDCAVRVCHTLYGGSFVMQYTLINRVFD